MTPSKTLCIDEYDAVGFDLDNTLAKYNLKYFFDFTYRILAEYLVEQKGYDKSLLHPIDLDLSFLCKGLILDTRKGNFLKVSEDGAIIRASHGTRFLTDEQIQQIYGDDRHWKEFEILCNAVYHIGDEYHIFENFFDLSGVVASARIIDLIDRQSEEAVQMYGFFNDVHESMLHCYKKFKIKDETDEYYQTLKSIVGKLVCPCSQAVKDWLTMLKNNNKIVFLMTSSYISYSTILLEYILGSDWEKYFHLTVTFARKPSFFHAGREFYSLEGFKEVEPVEELELGKCYSRGNPELIMKFLMKVTGKEQPQVLYFGDSLKSDTFPSKYYTTWKSVLIVEEMEAEGMLGYASKNAEETEMTKTKSEVGTSQSERECILSGKWGSFFADDGLPEKEGKQVNSLWSYIIRKYADVAIPQLDYIADLDIKHRFDVFNHADPTYSGFYPGIPKSLPTRSERI